MSFSLDSVSLRVGQRWLVRDLSMRIERGDVATIMGPSGIGKSSLLAYACGVLPPEIVGTGRVLADGEDLSGLKAHRRRLGILFQDDLLFPHLSVGDNLLFGLAAEIRGKSARRNAVEAALAEAEMPGLADRDPATLSGGQRARIALMRVMLSRPRALLLDEPFGRLDAALRERFRQLVFQAAKARGVPVLLVTHDEADARSAGGTVTRLE